ncbi:hypothetical protein GGI20_005640 [Coemansia sp. BCRC 34301]|nr:hypothetical protein GGI20_005640 [Coemansia sp. BCRC 34301]
MVVGQAENRSRQTFDGLGYKRFGNSELLLPLLWTYCNFHNIVYSRFCYNYSLKLESGTGEQETCWPGWPHQFYMRDHAAYHLVKKLYLELNIGTSAEGAWQQVGAEASIRTLVQRIKELAPRVSDISSGSLFATPFLEVSSIRLLNSLFLQLYQPARRAEYVHGCQFNPAASLFETPSNLTRITYYNYEHIVGASDRILRMILQSAETLRFLALGVGKYIDALGLIKDGNGNCVKYPCLESSVFEQEDASPSAKWSVTSGVILFPRLRHFTIVHGYPFGDDTLFRGNSATLEFVHIFLQAELCKILRQFKVFTPASHPKLQCMRTTKLYSDNIRGFRSTDEYAQFVLSIALDAAVRDFDLVVPVDRSFHALDVLKNHGNIQVLVLSNIELPLWLVVSLLEWLPLLSDLHCGSICPDPLTGDTAPDELLAYTQSLRVVNHERFRYWR